MQRSFRRAAEEGSISSPGPHSGRGSRRAARRAVLLAGSLLAALWPAAALANPPRPHWSPGAPWAPLLPASGEMHEISNLFWVVFFLSLVIFAFVTIFLFGSVVRYTARSNDAPEPKQVFGNRTVEIIWTLIPTVILMAAFTATVKSIHDINSPEKGAIMNVEVWGHQWWWEFRYPVQPQFGITAPVVTADEIHLPTGDNIHFHITSNDVVHSFWVPKVQRQIDANPGIDNAVFVKLNQPGSYDGACYEYCGTAHAWMKFRMIVQTPGQFRAWVKAQVANAAKPTTALERAGQKIFMSNTCVSCHVINYPGSKAHGVVGPNLTHVGSRWAIAGGATPLTTQDLMQWIRNPETYKPGVLMPGYPLLKTSDLRALATYLISLK